MTPSWEPPDFFAEMLVDEPEPVRELLIFFLEDTAVNLRLLKEASGQKALDMLHGLKGSCRQIGALKMGDIAEAMEAGDSAIDTLALENEFETVKAEMETAMRAMAVHSVDA